LDFALARDDGVAMALAGPYANHLTTTPVPHHSDLQYNKNAQHK